MNTTNPSGAENGTPSGTEPLESPQEEPLEEGEPTGNIEGEQVAEGEPEASDSFNFDLSEEGAEPVTKEEKPAHSKAILTLLDNFSDASEDRQAKKFISLDGAGRKKELQAIVDQEGFDSIKDARGFYKALQSDGEEPELEEELPKKRSSEREALIDKLLEGHADKEDRLERDRLVGIFARKNGVDADSIINDTDFISAYHNDELSNASVETRMEWAIGKMKNLKKNSVKTQDLEKKDKNARNMAALSVKKGYSPKPKPKGTLEEQHRRERIQSRKG